MDRMYSAHSARPLAGLGAVLLGAMACTMAGITPPTPTATVFAPITLTVQPDRAEATAGPPTPTITAAPIPTLTPSPPIPAITPVSGAPATVTLAPATEQTAAITPSGECGYDGSFYEDVTIPDGTPIEAGASFEKVWRLINDGCLEWGSGTRLVFSGGDRMGGPDSVPVRLTPPNNLVDVGVPLTAPAEPGTYKGYWQLQAPDGSRFGPRVFVEIVVVVPSGNATP